MNFEIAAGNISMESIAKKRCEFYERVVEELSSEEAGLYVDDMLCSLTEDALMSIVDTTTEKLICKIAECVYTEKFWNRYGWLIRYISTQKEKALVAKIVLMYQEAVDDFYDYYDWFEWDAKLLHEVALIDKNDTLISEIVWEEECSEETFLLIESRLNEKKAKRVKLPKKSNLFYLFALKHAWSKATLYRALKNYKLTWDSVDTYVDIIGMPHCIIYKEMIHRLRYATRYSEDYRWAKEQYKDKWLLSSGFQFSKVHK